MAVSSSSNPNLGKVTVGLSSVLFLAQSGAPTGIVAKQGSLYLRTDGSTTATRAYVNSDGDSTWVAVTTAS